VDGQLEDDPRSDLFSLGAVLLELLAGESLYEFKEGDTLYQRLMTIARADVTPALERLKVAQPSLVGVLHRALARDRQARFQSAREMSTALAGVATGLPPAVPLELFAESLYQYARAGRRTPALEQSLLCHNTAEWHPLRRSPLEAAQALPRSSRNASTARDDLADIHLERRPGMAMLAGMIVALVLVVGVLVAFWRPQEVREAIRGGAEVFSQQRSFISPEPMPTAAP